MRELGRITDPQAVPLDFYRLRGEGLRALDQFEDALEAYGRALAVDPEDIGVLAGMAWCYKRTGQLPKAIEAMEQAYQAHPKELIVLYNLACYFSLAGEKAQALSWLGRALRMESSLRKQHAEGEGALLPGALQSVGAVTPRADCRRARFRSVAKRSRLSIFDGLPDVSEPLEEPTWVRRSPELTARVKPRARNADRKGRIRLPKVIHSRSRRSPPVATRRAIGTR